MGSYTKLLVHLVWATHLRDPLIDAAIRARLHGYIGARCKEFGCLALAVGGVDDHVHLLVRLHPDVAVARLARELIPFSRHTITFPKGRAARSIPS
ncbi:MAG: transposase [Polyangiales bacterium]